jgi:lipoprotein-anchoring transpeptidase ErfK/SrfK
MGALLLPSTSGAVATQLRATATYPSSLSTNLPLLRLHFNAPTNASNLPKLASSPALTTRWQQIGPNDVQAVATEPLTPTTTYTFRTPTTVTCTSGTCVFTTTRARIANAPVNPTWEAQLLAELNYLPLTFTPSLAQSDPTVEASGSFTWAYPNLPTSLSAQWRVGTDNVILRGALMAFQNQSNIPTTGVVDATTWKDLLAAVSSNALDPASYNYVDVSMTLPETLTLYVAGQEKYQFAVNTGIAAAPTATGTYPVYQRFLSTTMRGLNPDGTPYSDPDIPDVSYFNGGDALHGFIRATYGWPQSLGCVEQPYSTAKTVFPYTPIGTLVTVHS